MRFFPLVQKSRVRELGALLSLRLAAQAAQGEVPRWRERGRGLGGSASAETPAGFPTFPVKTLTACSHSPRRKGLSNQSPTHGPAQMFKARCTAGLHGIPSVRLATKEKLRRNVITNPAGLSGGGLNYYNNKQVSNGVFQPAQTSLSYTWSSCW